MITTIKDFQVIVEMYKELKELSESMGKCDHSVGICMCGLYDTIERGRVVIEKSAQYLNLAPKKGKEQEWVSLRARKEK